MNTQSGNVLFALFGALAFIGVLSVGVSKFIKGPLTSSVTITRERVAENQMETAARVAVMAAANAADAGDCDSDGYVEPLQWKAGAAGSVPVNGGFVPDEIGINRKDPWGTEYGYCSWDHGSAVNAGGCGGAGQRRLAGTASQAYPVVALVSAGPDKVFNTTCRTFAAADANSDGDLADASDLSMISKASPSNDDIIMVYSYEEATGATGGLWSIKSTDPDTATIDKDIEVAGDAFFGGITSVGRLEANTGDIIDMVEGLTLPDASTYNPTCDSTLTGALRRDGTVLQICNGTGWTSIATGGAASPLILKDETELTTCDGSNVGQLRYNRTGPTDVITIEGVAPLQLNGPITSLTTTFSSSPAVGNTVIVLVEGIDAGGITVSTPAISDNFGNTYSLAAAGGPGGNSMLNRAFIFYGTVSTTGASFTITATFSGNNNYVGLSALNVAGLASGGSVVDLTASGNFGDTGTTTTISTIGSLLQPNELAVALFGGDSSGGGNFYAAGLSPATGWTQHRVNNSTTVPQTLFSAVSSITTTTAAPAHTWSHALLAGGGISVAMATFKGVEGKVGARVEICTGTGWGTPDSGGQQTVFNIDGMSDAIADYTLHNVLIGEDAGTSITGDTTTAIGQSALQATTTGYRNTVVGYNAGSNLTTGHHNTIIGSGNTAAAATTNYSVDIGDTIYGVNSNGRTAIGTTAYPVVNLVVNGEVILGNTEAVCETALSGAMRLNEDNKSYEWCNGLHWLPMDPSCDTYPDNFPIPPEVGAALNSQISSSIVQITGMSCANANVRISGEGNPEYRVCSTSNCSTVVQNWTNTVTEIASGQYIQVRLTSANQSLRIRRAYVTIGGQEQVWPVTTLNTGTSKLVFVTSEVVSTNFMGIAGADAICNNLAQQAGWGGTFMAWLATSAADDPESRFTRASVPYRLTDGTQVADNWNDLVDGDIDFEIYLTEENRDIRGSGQTITNVNTNGTVYNANMDCMDWSMHGSSAQGHGAFGVGYSTDASWTDGSWAPVETCDDLYAAHLMCFEQ